MHMLSWRIGSIIVTQIIEVEAGAVLQKRISGATPENIKKIAWLRPHFADAEGNIRAVVQAFLVQSGGEKILVDSCVGNGRRRVDIPEWSDLQTEFLALLADIGCQPAEVSKVICTHLHFDHVGWNTRWNGEQWVPTFPNAKYLLAQEEFDYWKTDPPQEAGDDKAAFAESILPVYAAGLVSLVPTIASIGPGISLIPTPGHTPAHVSILLVSEGESAIITGDAVHHPCQVANPDWYSLSDTDRELATTSRKRLVLRCCDTSTIVIGSHFAPPTAGLIRRDGASFRFVAS
jgi:glyoxylase-like metal-dependent hydrolase (beta-lactamase superfamily II)